MLLLLAQAGDQRLAVLGSAVLEVVPMVEIHRVAGAPGSMAGVIDHRGARIPVIDLTYLLQGRNSAELMSTRIIVVGLSDGGGLRPLGIMAERVTDAMEWPGPDLPPCDAEQEGPFRGQVTLLDDQQALVLDLDSLLPADLLGELFAAASRET